MGTKYDVFVSYSHNDREAADALRRQLAHAGLHLFRDVEEIRHGDRWLDAIQDALDGCGAFVLLVGRDGVRRWVGGETQVALNRHFGPHDDAARLPIFPVLLSGATPEALPAFLRLFQAPQWDGESELPDGLVAQVCERRSRPSEALRVDGCPYVGFKAFDEGDAHLFFGRQKEILYALDCFDIRDRDPNRQVRWLEISGGSGSGKSSLMRAGLLPLVDQGWLWPRTGFERWHRIGPVMPGERPLSMLAERLAHAFSDAGRTIEMSAVREHLEADDDRRLAEWLRTRKPDDDTAFLLAVDQFEELFTVADPAERRRFDRLLAEALVDPECPLFVVSTVRSDFLDRLDQLPRLVDVRNRHAAKWTLPMMPASGLREIIDRPAWLARLDVVEVRDLIVTQAEGEEGVLPLVQNALAWLWENRRADCLSGQVLREAGGIPGILSRNAENLLQTVDRGRALELLLRLVRVDPEGRRHARQRISLADAVATAGGGDAGRTLVDQLAGRRSAGPSGPLRLIVVTPGPDPDSADGATVNLIHETLIRSRPDKDGNPQPYWPTLWSHIEAHRARAVQENRVRLLALEIDDAARAWVDGGRPEDGRWTEERCEEVIREVRRAGLEMSSVLRDDDARAFFGPIDRSEIARSLKGEKVDDANWGAGFYGERWRLPLSHRARAHLGDRLALVGDDRPGVGLRDGVPDIDWCDIASGEVTINADAAAGTVATLLLRRNPRRVPPFKMARYPVTIQQFGAFVAACYREGRWEVAGFPAERLGEPPTHTRRFGNHPADSVNWYHATAFCRWLSGQLGFEVRLPTEFEWQLAATGGDPANTYPWGADWQPEGEPWRANTAESRLARATAVGLYPRGASRAGIHDLAGTVKEWCSSTWYLSLDHLLLNWQLSVTRHGRNWSFSDAWATGWPILRGGSWEFSEVRARCAGRTHFPPSLSHYGIGFRVVCSSPISSADR